MSVLVAIVPKQKSDSLNRTASSLASICSKSLAPSLGSRYPTDAHAISGLTATGGVLLEWRAVDQRSGFALRKGRWTASTAPQIAENLLNDATTIAGRLVTGSSSYGTYMAMAGDRNTDRLIAWNTVPTVEAVHYAEDRDFIYVSNRPLGIAICLAARQRRKIRLSDEYAAQYLVFGFCVSDITPFEGVKVLAPRQALSIGDGVLRLIAAPNEPLAHLEDTEQATQKGSRELTDALRSATRRQLELQGDKPIQLRLSGGLDSRLLLGLLREAGAANVTSVCQGSQSSEEAMVAAELADLAGTEYFTTVPNLIDRNSMVGSFLKSIEQSQGFIPSEALVSPYAVADPITDGESLAAGQWPLFKGVLERRANNPLENMWNGLKSRADLNLSPKFNHQVEQSMRNWYATIPAISNHELLYMWGRDIRSSRYLQPHTIQVDLESQMFYPFLDSEVTRIADALPFMNRLRQYAMFYALQEIWPESLKVPVANNGRFRFETSGPVDGVSGESFEMRTAPPKPLSEPVRNLDAFSSVSDQEFVKSPVVAAAKFVLGSSSWRQLRRMLSDEMRTIVVRSSKLREADARKLAPKDKSGRWLQLMMWRYVLVAIWLEGDWIPSIRR